MAREVIEHGFVVVQAGISQGSTKALKESLEQQIHELLATRTQVTGIDDYMVHNPMVKDQVFLEVLENPAVIGAMDALLGDTSILYAFTTSSMPPSGTNYSHRVHVDCPRIIPNYITNIGIIVALDNFTEDNGATYFLPNSQLMIEKPSDEVFYRDAVRVFPQAGDFVVFNARTWHLGGTNSTGRFRHALTINACRSFMRQRFDYPRLIGWEKGKTLSPTLRRVLGYNVRVPSSLEEYYLPDDERLYLPNQG
jgi:ectoine hydroxylase-related dioxygenase (phytanoyl-CoA dioxygenase family)